VTRPGLSVACQARTPPHSEVLCDIFEHASHGGELAAAVDDGAVGREDVTELTAVLTGVANGRRRAGALFDSTGLVMQDLAIAKAGYAKASELDFRLSTSSRIPPRVSPAV
jgi:ornithine cyclodeaminase/alanine dehydrogenase-like protein (mu-crystallin family)